MRCLATGGDIDGDGFTDLLVGAPLADAGGVGNSGRVFIVNGAYVNDPANPNLQPITATFDAGADRQANAQFGAALAVIGDVTGGAPVLDDLVVGAPNFSPAGKSKAGKVYVYAGAAFGTPNPLIAQREGDSANDNFGAALAPLGNLGTQAPILDQTSTPDFLVGAPGWDPNSVAVLNRGDLYAFGVTPNQPLPLIYQASQAPAPSNHPPVQDGWRFGTSIAAGGRCLSDPNDPNGLYPDAVVGAPDALGIGRVIIVSHRASSVVFSSFSPPPVQGGTLPYFAASVALLDRETAPSGRKFADLLVGAPLVTEYPIQEFGRAYFYYRPTANSLGQVIEIDNPARDRYDYFGAMVTTSISAGGSRKLHITTPFDNFDDPQPLDNIDTSALDLGSLATYEVTVDPNDVASVSPDPQIPTKYGTLAGTQFGFSVSGKVDIDGDGTDDILVGAPRTDSPTQVNGGYPFYLNPRGCDEGVILVYSGGLDNALIGETRIFGFGESLPTSGQGHPQFGSVVVGLPAFAPGGRDQFIGTAPYYENYPYPDGDDGYAAVYALSPVFLDIMEEQRLELSPPRPRGRLGFAATRIGNVVTAPGETVPENDLAISAPESATSPVFNYGIVAIYAGRAADDELQATTPIYMISQSTLPDPNALAPMAEFGHSLGIYEVFAGSPPTLETRLLVGAPFNDSGGQMENGSVFVFRLSATSATYLGAVHGASTGDNFGTSVAGSWDLSGDGAEDFLAGAPGYDDSLGHSNTGRVYMYSGVPAGGTFPLLGVIENSAPGYVPTGADLFGQSIAGKINGVASGVIRPQIVVGAPGADIGTEVNRGAAFTYTIGAGGGAFFRSLLTNNGDIEHRVGDRFAVSLAGVGALPLGGGEQSVIVVGAPLVDALDPDLRLIRNKGRSYAFSFTDIPTCVPPPCQ